MSKIYKNEDDLVSSLIDEAYGETSKQIKVKQRQINIYSLVYDKKTEFQYNTYDHEFIILVDNGRYIIEKPLNSVDFEANKRLRKAFMDFELQVKLMEELV